MKNMDFEEAIGELEAIVAKLEKGDISLDASLKQYEEGIKLVRVCREKLGKAKSRIDELTKNDDGSFKKEPFPEK
ncbi:MAG: exodeoxyribonuclease VII small subunit [Candidatus Omnitrophica bacterium]|nr:exodeoxyribonuclease VII small subunit [Candidatus Omnitrophota bacterium]